jgi:N5-(cytidine 5'-diphosphoramidyl)-L-glutamine hydrolase
MRIGITQRVEKVTSYEEDRDCLDQRWPALLELLEMTAIPIPNNLKKIESWLDTLALDGFIFTGGNDLTSLPDSSNTSYERDLTEFTILEYARAHFLPVFAVCRGLQVVNIFLGGGLERVSNHVAKRHAVHSEPTEPDFSSIINVNSFHEWGLPIIKLADQLKACVYDNDSFVEAARHKNLNWVGVMWHPEREIPFQDADLALINKLFNEGFL